MSVEDLAKLDRELHSLLRAAFIELQRANTKCIQFQTLVSVGEGVDDGLRARYYSTTSGADHIDADSLGELLRKARDLDPSVARERRLRWLREEVERLEKEGGV